MDIIDIINFTLCFLLGIIVFTYKFNIINGYYRMTTKPDKQQQLRASGTLNHNPKRVTDPLFREHAFFDARDLVQIKYEMLRRVVHDGHSITEAAAAFGFSRPAFYKAKQALEESGLAGLVPAKTGPRGAHKLNEEVMAFVLAAIEHDPALNSRVLVARIAAQFGLSVHPRSVERALTRKKKPGSQRSRRDGPDEA